MSRTSQGVDRRCLIDLFDACIEEHAGLLIPRALEYSVPPLFKSMMVIALSVLRIASGLERSDMPWGFGQNFASRRGSE
jgi:hypothetical protein